MTSPRPFEGFNQLHRDLYLRLKLRSLESRLPKPKQVVDDRPPTALSTQSDLPVAPATTELQAIKDRLFTLEQKFGMIAHLGSKVEHDLSSFQKELVRRVEDQVKEAREGAKTGLGKVESMIQSLQNTLESELRPKVDKAAAEVTRLWGKKDFYFSDSLILENNDQVGFVVGEIPDFNHNTKVSLLYRGSRDGWMHQDFHNLCDKQGATIVLYKTKKGRICGGFTRVGWTSPVNGDYRFDVSAYVFSVDLKQRF